MTPTGDRFDRLLEFLRRLTEARIPHRLEDYRQDAISVIAHAPGEYWEIDFLADGDIDIERYRSIGVIEEASNLDELFAMWADEPPAVPPVQATPVSRSPDAATTGK
jgi:hypothetical protein